MNDEWLKSSLKHVYWGCIIVAMAQHFLKVLPGWAIPCPDSPQITNFANFGPKWMKIGLHVINGEQSSKLEKVFWFDHDHPYPLPLSP